MDVFLEKCRKFFTDVFEKIGIFFKKIVERINDLRVFLCSEIKKFFEKIKLKREEFLKNRAIKRDEKKAAKQAKKEEKLKAKQEREQRRHIKDKLLIFLVLYILLFATFQFSCGFDFKVVRIKFISFVCLAFVVYIAVLYIFDEVFRNLAILMLSEMKMPIKWL